MPRGNSKQRRYVRRPNPSRAWGGRCNALVSGQPDDVADVNLTDPTVRKGVFFSVSPSRVVLPTRNGVKPADMRFFSFLLTVATGAQFGTAGFITAYFTTDEDNMSSTGKWDAIAVNSILDFKEQARMAGCSIGWHRTVASNPGEIRTTFDVSTSISMKNYDCDDANNTVARVYFFFPAGLNPTVRLYARCAFEGVESASASPTTFLSEEVRYDTVYDTYSLDFLRRAFKQLARPVFFNAHVDGASIVSERGLFVLYSRNGHTSDDISEPAMDLLIESDLVGYRPSLNGIVFPRRDPVTNLLSSSLSTWCRQKIFVPTEPGLPPQFWWSHVPENAFNVACGRDVQLVDCYERSPTITPRNRTAAEILTSCTSGMASLSVAANDRPANRGLTFSERELLPLLESLRAHFPPLNAFLTERELQDVHRDCDNNPCWACDGHGPGGEPEDDDLAEEEFARQRSG